MENNNVLMSDIGGYTYQKNEINKIIKFLKNYDYYISSGAKLSSGIVLYGAPGTGKTTFAHVVANESNVPLIDLNDFDANLSNLERIEKAFDTASKSTPCVLLIDELDQLVNCSNYGMSPSTDSQRECLKCLLTNIDKYKEKGIIVIATCNTDIEDIPDALCRNGRIEKHISVGMPDLEDRTSIIELYLNKNDIFSEISARSLARLTCGISCSGLATLINDVLIQAISEQKDKVSICDFTSPLQAIISNGIKSKDSKNNDHVIYHEIGHLISDYILNDNVGIISVSSYGGSRGRYNPFNINGNAEDSEEDASVLTYDDIRNKSIVALSGLAATKVFLNTKYLGASSDIKMCSNFYTKLAQHGLLDDFDIVSTVVTNDRRYSANFMDVECCYIKGFSKFLKECYEEAETIIKENYDLCQAMFKELKDKRTMTSDEVKAFIDKHKDIITHNISTNISKSVELQ